MKVAKPEHASPHRGNRGHRESNFKFEGTTAKLHGAMKWTCPSCVLNNSALISFLQRSKKIEKFTCRPHSWNAKHGKRVQLGKGQLCCLACAYERFPRRMAFCSSARPALAENSNH